MSAPSVITVLPAPDAEGVILQGAVIVTFDQEIDPTTFSESTFLLSGPGVVGVTTPGAMLEDQPAVDGREFVQGKFSFAQDAQGRTIATFRPDKPLRPNVKYDVMVAGVCDPSGVVMVDNYAWSFKTGVINLKVPPAQNPLPAKVGRIREDELIVTPSATLNEDLGIIEIAFPDVIDESSIDTDAIAALVSVEAFLQDPDIPTPKVTKKTVEIDGNKLIVKLTFA